MRCILDPHVARNGVNGLHEDISPQSLLNGEKTSAVRAPFAGSFNVVLSGVLIPNWL